jgi:predicted phosphodiesterase
MNTQASGEMVRFAGDWHGDRDHATQIIKGAAALDIETVIQLGDWGYWAHTREGSTYPKYVNKYAALKGVRVIWLDGNHENHPHLWETYPVGDDGFAHMGSNLLYSPRGNTFTISNTRFLTVGGAYSVDRSWRVPGKSWWATEMINDDEMRKAMSVGKVDVLLSHDAPEGVDIPCMRADDKMFFQETVENRDRLRQIAEAVQPNIVFHGHYHERYSSSFRLNSGREVRVEGIASNIERIDLSFIDVRVL